MTNLLHSDTVPLYHIYFNKTKPPTRGTGWGLFYKSTLINYVQAMPEGDAVQLVPVPKLGIALSNVKPIEYVAPALVY